MVGAGIFVLVSSVQETNASINLQLIHFLAVQWNLC